MGRKLDNKIEKAFDDATLNSSDVYLNEEQVDKFVDYVKDQSKLLNMARTMTMDKPIKPIKRMITGEKFLKPGAHGNQLGQNTEWSTSEKQIESRVVRGQVKLLDDELKDNLEGEAFEQHLMRLIAKKMANELDMTAYNGRRVGDYSVANGDEGIKGYFDGYKYIAEQNNRIIDATTDDFSDRYLSKGKMKQSVRNIANKYRTDLEFLANSDAYMDFGDLFNTTDKQGPDIRTSVYGKNVVEIPLMDVEEPVVDGTASSTANGTADAGQKDVVVADGTNFASGQNIVVARGTKWERTYEIDSVSTDTLTLTEDLLYDVQDGQDVETCTKDGNSIIVTNPKNLVYGIYDQIQMEPERVPAVGYIFHYKGRIAVDIENTDAISVLTNLKANI